MKRILVSLLLISACQLVGISACCFAQPQQSANFRITKSVLDAGGQLSTSTNFRLVSAFGQPTPIGVASSANFTLSSGFLSPAFSASPLSPIQNLVMIRQPASTNMKLDWGAITGATLYTIYRDVTPTFTPGPANQIGTSATNTFTDLNAVNLPLSKYFYIVTSTAGTIPAVIELPNFPTSGSISSVGTAPDNGSLTRQATKQNRPGMNAVNSKARR
jgi:hypothetical protein